MEREKNLSIYRVASSGSDGGQPIMNDRVAAGFPSPAEDYSDVKLDLNRLVVRNPASTFYARVSGLSMVGDGVDDGDLLVIDKSVEPTDGVLAVCFVDGEFTLKRFENHGDYGLLLPSNPDFEPIRVDADNEFLIWGVVTYVIKKM
ncbi:MAG: translesion error-prone DNA polymerase V autoproteolytic subunit [Rikenellaceae bacterium]